MGGYLTLKNELLHANKVISGLIKHAAEIAGIESNVFEDWTQTSTSIDQQLSEEILRVAVVGAIKSGKSTFINSVLGKDYLKRGAGVVTSIVTRVRAGDGIKAKLVFKTWDEINEEMNRATVLFPALEDRDALRHFDIRRLQDRQKLAQALKDLEKERLLGKETRSLNSVLLTSYIDGFEVVQGIVASETVTHTFDGPEFQRHREFVGDETLAVYLQDIELEVAAHRLGRYIELADCQGSDSPNPLHMAMIQDYLLLTHLIIYVISSRTGLRRADIRFLSMIKRMGILDNILFVINCDCYEHDSLADLRRVVHKTDTDLALLKPDPPIFTISALLNLFESDQNKLSTKDRQRHEQWLTDMELVTYLRGETQRFYQAFDQKLTGERAALLLSNHLDRIGVISDSMANWLDLTHNVLTSDQQSAEILVQKLRQHRDKLKSIQTAMKSTLDGATQELKRTLRTETDRFLDEQGTYLLRDLIDFIRKFRPTSNSHEDEIRSLGFSTVLYMVFQEFQQALDTYMTEEVTPRIIRFVRDMEALIKHHLDAVAAPYDDMVQDALSEYDHTLDRFEINRAARRRIRVELADIDSIRQSAQVNLPKARTNMAYTAKIRAEAIFRLGFYRFTYLLKKVLKRNTTNNQSEGNLALRDGIIRMKRETEKSVRAHFKNYRENLKFAYFFKLADVAAVQLHDLLFNRFQGYAEDLIQCADRMGKAQTEKERIVATLVEMTDGVRDIQAKMQSLKSRIDEMAKGQPTTNQDQEMMHSKYHHADRQLKFGFSAGGGKHG